ncbi:reverse transcriptase domain-containing protein [Tanacetum coccineum]
MPINRGLLQAIPTSLPPQPIREATKASNIRRIPHRVQGRSRFTYFLYLIIQIRIVNYGMSRRRYSHHGTILSTIMRKPGIRYCPPSKTAKQLKDIHNFKQEGDKSLYQAWERYNDMLYKCPTHDINNHQKVNIFYKGLSPMNRQLLDSHGPILGMRLAKTLTAIQTMADHSQKWQDETTSRSIRRNNSNVGLGWMPNLQRTSPRQGFPLNKEVKQVEERQSLEELLAKHQEESARRTTKIEGWIKKLQEISEINTRNQSASLKNLETQIEQLTREIHSDKIRNSSSKQIKTVTSDQETFGLNKLHGVSFISGPLSNTPEVLQHQLPPKELNPGIFTFPCTIGKFNFYTMADLGASINVMPRSIFEHLHLTNLKKTNMLCKMADMPKKALLGIVENVLVKIDKFLFPSDFVILDNTPSETTILGRPFLATIHAEIDVFAGKIALGINEDRISFDTMRKDHNYTNPSNWDNKSSHFNDQAPKKRKINFDENVPIEHLYIVNNPTYRSFDDYKWEFNLEIDKLDDEYELGIGKKGHILDNIWENCNQVHNKNYEWHNYEFKNEECQEIGIEEKDYHPPEVQVETFKVKKYSFEGGQIFICVTKYMDNILPLRRKNISKFKEMIRKEVENNRT